MYTIRMGVPEMEQFWSSLVNKVDSGTASANDMKLYKNILGIWTITRRNNHPCD